MYINTHIGKKTKTLVLFLALSLFLAVGFYAYSSLIAAKDALAQSDSQSQTEQEKQRLQQQLDALQRELQEIQSEINKYSSEAASYERDINILESEIRKIRLEMQRNQLILDETSHAIKVNAETINYLNNRILTSKELLSKLLLSIYKLDDTSSVEIFLATQSLSEFFNDINNIKKLQEGMADTLEEIKIIKLSIEKEQDQLELRLQNQVQLLHIQAAQRGQVAQKVSEQEELLRQSRSKEHEYRDIAQQTQKTISEVRNQIFRLEGAGVAVTFEEAYGYAQMASQLTGVRPAFLLSVLKQESSWGANVGLCYLENAETGMGKGVNTGRLIPRVMRVDRDIQPFFQITSELGRDPYATRISCWPEIYYQGQPFGYGGAMGPAQFLPSTWMGHRERVGALLGRPADPWRIDDAFLASAVKLAGGGAAQGTYNAEWCAAMIYYSGRCPGLQINQFYANAIMARAEEYQRDINILEGR